jgi:amylosucrase
MTDAVTGADADAATAPDPLASLSADRRELFEIRVERWEPDLRAGLAAVYPPDQVEPLLARLLGTAARVYAERPADLHRLDLVRTVQPDWFQQPAMLGYAAYADRFGGDLAGVAAQIPYLTELGVTYLHLMPLLRPRAGDNDGGYAVADEREIRADLGSIDDLPQLAAALRGHGISLVLDLVLNHVAREHRWAEQARAGDVAHRDYFHVFADREQPDAYERSLAEVFPTFAPGNFSWDEQLRGWVWTTFNEFQWDLNWANPDVFAEFAAILLGLANLGVEVIRLDAIAFVWKRLGTSCQNQPEVHAIAQSLRALTRIACPAVLLKAEAIVGPADLVQYLGQGRHHGKVSDLAYHNTLMVQIWSMLASRDVRLAAHALRGLPPTPATTAWICYLRCHDDIGWAIADSDAAAVGLSGAAHRQFLSDFYTGQHPGAFGAGLAFQANPATGDRRVSGMTSTLVGLDAAIAAGDDAAVDLAVARVLLAHAIVLGWGGIPVLWMGDELGLPSDGEWADEPGHASDNRWFHRPRLSARQQADRRRPGTPPARIFAGLRHLVQVRSQLAALHAATPSQVPEPSDPAVLAVRRSHPEGELLELFNVSEDWRPWPADRLAELGLHPGRDALSDQPVRVEDDGNVWLAPYAAMWIVSSAPPA